MIGEHAIQRFEMMRSRLHDFNQWFPLPAFIGVGFAIILFSKVMIDVNPRTSNPAALHEGTGTLELPGSLWFSVVIEDDQVMVYTDEKVLFSWSAENPENGDFKDFRAYLVSRSEEKLSDLARFRRITQNETRVVISTDRKTTWYHLHPVITALSQAGFDSYGFETKIFKGDRG